MTSDMASRRSSVESTSQSKICVNVGGSEFFLKTSLLHRFKYSRLCRLWDCKDLPRSVSFLCDEYDPVKNVYYFDRDAESFLWIKKCYEGGTIHIPRSICPLRFVEEKEYWGVGDAPLDVCCEERLRNASTFVEELDEEVRNKVAERDRKSEHANMTFKKIHEWKDLQHNMSKIRWHFWGMFTEPGSSMFGKLWALTSVGFIVLSLLTFVLGTLEAFEQFDEEGLSIENPAIATIEKICNSWFTMEYLFRLLVAPNKFGFVRQIMNIIDLVTIIPYYVQLYLTYSSDSDRKLESVSHLLQIFRVMRVMRVFRLGRHSAGLQVLCKTFVRSSTELALLGLYFFMGIIILSTAAYTVEDKKFRHIGDSLWWATITVTTVGYGDICPDTIPGKLIASMAFLIGILAIGVPIHPIIANFTYYYKRCNEIEYAFQRTMKQKTLEAFNRTDDSDQYLDNRRIAATEKNVSFIRRAGSRRRSTIKRPSNASQASSQCKKWENVPCNCMFCND